MGAEARDPFTASDIVLLVLGYVPPQPPAAAAAAAADIGGGGGRGRTSSGGAGRISSGGRASGSGAGGSKEAAPGSLYLTCQFFSFPPTRTPTAKLVAAGSSDSGATASGSSAAGHAGLEQQLLLLQVPDAAAAGGSTSSGSLAARYLVDGSQLAPSAEPGAADSAAFEQHLQLCRYLASRRLQLELWDGASHLPLGSAQLELQVRWLLRYG
jgi:hypothetical protein